MFYPLIFMNINERLRYIVMGARILIFSRQGSQMADVTVGELPVDEEANFRGVLSILEPICQAENEYLFTMKLGLFHIDVYYASERYVLSIIPGTTKANMLGFNPIFAWAAGLCFASMLSGRDGNGDVSPQMLDAFEAMMPQDPLNAVAEVINKLMIPGVNYVSFIAQGHRVFLSLGETKMNPEDFIVAWCAALEAADGLQDNPWVIVEEFENIAVTQFVPCMTVVVFFEESAVKSRVEFFVSEIQKAKQRLVEIFQTEEKRPQMPQAPKNGPVSRRPGRH